MIGISGAGGCGKTTLLLQLMKYRLTLDVDKLYISMDDLYFTDPLWCRLRRNFLKPEANASLRMKRTNTPVGPENSKDGRQIKGVPNSFLVLDGIEYSDRDKIPLWLFGFLY